MKKHALALSIALSTCFISQSAEASAWVGTQDKQLHYDLQTLVEWGYLELAVTSFPVPWKGVASALSEVSPEGMSFRPRQAYERLTHYLNLHESQQARRFATLQTASDDVRFRSLDDGVEETFELTFTNEFYYKRLSGQLSVNYASGGELNLDNSFVAYQFGNWNLRLGSLDQFWGPVQSSSLILSNNARPIPTLAFSRSQSTRSESKWLRWIGPWYFTTQVGQLEEDRFVPNTKIILTRFNARPFKGLEVGASWAVQWGGDGQPSDLSAFIEIVTFQNVCRLPSGVCTPAQLTKQGNSLAGFDLSYTTNIFSRPVSIYAQRIGEDAVDNIRITDNANLFGVSTYFGNAKVFLETSDTNVNCDGNVTDNLNCYYENGTYQTGYRTQGRAIGSTFDSDARQITLGTNYRFADGAVVELYLRSAELNRDGESPSPVLTDSVSEDVLELSGFYQRPYRDWLLKAGATIANRDLVESTETDGLLYFKAQYHF